MEWNHLLRNPAGSGYSRFSSWGEVVDHVGYGKVIYYQAPLDQHPVRVQARVVGGSRKKKIRVTPPSSDADPFIADSGHLSRFRKA